MPKRTFIPILLFLIMFLACQPTIQKKEGNIAFKLFSLAFEQYQSENYDGALEHINKAIEINKRIAGYFELKGDIQTKQGEFRDAIIEYEKALVLRSFLPEVYLKRGHNYFILQEYEKAIPNYKKAISQRPQQAKILLNLAECYLQQSELSLTVNILKEYTLQIKKQKGIISRFYYVLLAKIKFEEEKYSEVNLNLLLAQRHGAFNRNEGMIFVLSLIKVNQLEQAYSLATKLLKGVLSTPDVHSLRGLYYFKLSNFKDAKTQFELGIKNQTTLYEAYTTLAKIYSGEGNSEKAKKVLDLGGAFKNQRLINFALGY